MWKVIRFSSLLKKMIVDATENKRKSFGPLNPIVYENITYLFMQCTLNKVLGHYREELFCVRHITNVFNAMNKRQEMLGLHTRLGSICGEKHVLTFRSKSLIRTLRDKACFKLQRKAVMGKGCR